MFGLKKNKNKNKEEKEKDARRLAHYAFTVFIK